MIFNRRLVAASLLSSFIVVPWSRSVKGQQPPDDRIQVALDLTRIAYPNVTYDSAEVTLIGSLDRAWRLWFPLTVSVYAPFQPGSPPVEPQRRLLVSGMFNFEPAGSPELQSASFTGREVDKGPPSDFPAATSEATESGAERALKAVGGKFPPSARRAFLEETRVVERFSPVLGALRETSVEFVVMRHEFNSQDLVDTRWLVRVEATRGDRRDCYTFLFRPGSGALSGIGRQSCR